jgi:hypothetical protein
MTVREALKTMHASLELLAPEVLAKLERTLEEELAIVKTLIAIQRVRGSREQILDSDAGEDPFLTIVDMDAEEQPQRTRRSRPEPGKLTAEIVSYLQTAGPAETVTIKRHFRERGYASHSVGNALKQSHKFKEVSGGMWDVRELERQAAT